MSALIITFGWWVLPAIVTLVCCGFVLHIFTREDDSDYFSWGMAFNVIDGLLVCLPIAVVWGIYFAVSYYGK